MQDVDKNDVLCLEYDLEDYQYPRLNHIVRHQYLKYLEKQLKENYCTWKECQAEKNAKFLPKGDEKLKNFDQDLQSQFIRHTAELLEDKAVQACMISRFYQRAMVRIIGNVRNCTQDQRLVKQLANNLLNCQNHLESKNLIKEQPQLVQENVKGYKGDKTNMYSENVSQDVVRMEIDEEKFTNKTDNEIMDLNGENKNSSGLDMETSNDSVDIELARIFNEDCNELDEIFGIKDNGVNQDPLMARILEEIEQSEVEKHVNHKESNETNHTSQRRLSSKNVLKVNNDVKTKQRNNALTETYCRKDGQKHPVSLSHPLAHGDLYTPRVADLSKSLWPCELYRQKKKLTYCLTCLIDEDYRWMDIFRWKFEHLFGDDSDDEFIHCSPSIELDDVLIGSCVRRITPWIVKHLMPPLRDGLISNRFLFKKLAKQLSHAIVIVNQYPDESFIKYAIENFFCIRNRVNSLDDLVEMPNIFMGYG